MLLDEDLEREGVDAAVAVMKERAATIAEVAFWDALTEHIKAGVLVGSAINLGQRWLLGCSQSTSGLACWWVVPLTSDSRMPRLGRAATAACWGALTEVRVNRLNELLVEEPPALSFHLSFSYGACCLISQTTPTLTHMHRPTCHL